MMFRKKLIIIMFILLTYLHSTIFCQSNSVDTTSEEISHHRSHTYWIMIKAQHELRCDQAWMQLLNVSEAEWKQIKPKYDAISKLMGAKGEELRGAISYRGSLSDDKHLKRKFEFIKYTENVGFTPPMIDEMTEGQRLVDELIDLLEDDQTDDQTIRQKIDALQQARAKARVELPVAKQALRASLTTRRQEAIFLVKGWID